MTLTDAQLIAEAVEVNHADVKEKTLERYEDHLVHYSQYLFSARGGNFYSAKPKDVRAFMKHLEKRGGPSPDKARAKCSWCKATGYATVVTVPAGRRAIARATWRRSSSSIGTSSPRKTCPITTRRYMSVPADRRQAGLYAERRGDENAAGRSGHGLPMWRRRRSPSKPMRRGRCIFMLCWLASTSRRPGSRGRPRRSG